MKINVFKNKNYNVHTINVNNFRSCSFSLVFRCKFDEKKAVAFSILSDLLTDASKKYPSPKYVSRYIESNYILDFYGSFSRSGKTMQTYIFCNYVDPKYIKDENYIDTVYKFIFDMINNPLISDNKFDEKTFSVVKNRLLTELAKLKEDNNFLSIHKALQIFASDKATSFHHYDMMDFIKNLTSEDLYKYYLELINESSIDIFVTSSSDDKLINKTIKKYSHFDSAKYVKYTENVTNNKRRIPKKVVDKSSFKQSTLVMVFNIDEMTMFEREFVMSYYINIINKGGLNSKLYKALRGENSLCYNVETNCYDRSNLLLVKTVIRPGTESKAIKLIKKCIKDMKDKISNEEFMGAYYAYQSALKGMVDSIGAINRLYMNIYYAGFSTYEEKQVKFKKVTIDDINNLASKIKLNTIYVLKGDKNERNQN